MRRLVSTLCGSNSHSPDCVAWRCIESDCNLRQQPSSRSSPTGQHRHSGEPPPYMQDLVTNVSYESLNYHSSMYGSAATTAVMAQDRESLRVKRRPGTRRSALLRLGKSDNIFAGPHRISSEESFCFACCIPIFIFDWSGSMKDTRNQSINNTDRTSPET